MQPPAVPASQDEAPELLTPRTVLAYLRTRGVISAGDGWARELTGGVSNIVLAVDIGEQRLVVKQALPRLRVAAVWLAKQERILTEAEALLLAHQQTPGRVPPLVDVDTARCAITIERAPDHWQTWKEALLAGDADTAVAAELGSVLGTWHEATPAPLAPIFHDVEAFEQLRLAPYYRAVAHRRPELAEAIYRHMLRMARNRRCLVHGDFSPKNILVGDGQVWVLDFEVAHLGDPAFDRAFLIAHLMLKALHRPSALDRYAACAEAFEGAYTSSTRAHRLEPAAQVLGQVGCLIAARVDGKSPVEYLTVAQQAQARRVGAHLLLDPPCSMDQAWSVLAAEMT